MIPVAQPYKNELIQDTLCDNLNRPILAEPIQNSRILSHNLINPNEQIYFNKCFLFNIIIDIIVKSGYILYSPYFAIHIFFGLIGIIGAYIKKTTLLYIYIFYQSSCGVLSIILLLNIDIIKNQIIDINKNYWYFFILFYLAESLFMIYMTKKEISIIN